MRKSVCEATIKSSTEVDNMSIDKIDNVLLTTPIKAKKALVALLLAISKGNNAGELDDWEYDLGNVLFTEIKHSF